MSISDVLFSVIVATGVFVGLIIAYALGYRAGVAYCASQVKSLEILAEQLRKSARER